MGTIVNGLPVTYYSNVDGFYVSALFQNVVVEGSPLVVRFNPPVATVEEASLLATIGLAKAILDGATIQP